ncbi:MAG: methyltransferase domain-containing protein [bacterium]|nr:methyltransferase domain-containing protein [bacterium]
MSIAKMEEANEKVRETWDANAAFWNGRMGEGNDFVNYLVWPATEKLLHTKAGEEVLDIACGNGFASRKLAGIGAKVTAFDFSRGMIDAAAATVSQSRYKIDYRRLDACDPSALLELRSPANMEWPPSPREEAPEHNDRPRFDAALCCMALFDMADIGPLFKTLPKLLKPDGSFVFSLLHPCFNSDRIGQTAEMEDREGDISTRYGVKVWGYMTSTVSRVTGIPGQPEPHPYFHRPLEFYLRLLFENGFVLDGFEECAFPPDYEGGTFPLSWNGNYSEIPPVLVARARLTAPAG